MPACSIRVQSNGREFELPPWQAEVHNHETVVLAERVRKLVPNARNILKSDVRRRLVAVLVDDGDAATCARVVEVHADGVLSSRRPFVGVSRSCTRRGCGPYVRVRERVDAQSSDRECRSPQDEVVAHVETVCCE